LPVDPSRVDETRAQYRVVPVEYDGGLLHSRLLERGQPYLLVGKLAKEVPSDRVV